MNLPVSINTATFTKCSNLAEQLQVISKGPAAHLMHNFVSNQAEPSIVVQQNSL